MSGVPAEQDNETTDYRTTRQRQRAEGKGQRAKERNKTSRHRDNGTTAQDKAEGKALPEWALR